MPAWIEALNFISARLRRAVLLLLMLAAVQAAPSLISASDADQGSADYSQTLRRAID
jgi:hypothetical protein